MTKEEEKKKDIFMPIWGRFGLTMKQFAALVLVMTIIPVFVPLGLPLTVSQPSKDFYNTINELSEGSIVAIGGHTSYAFYQSAKDVMKAIYYQLCDNSVKFIIYSFISDGPQGALETLRYANIEEVYGYVYGQDFVVFPYLEGGETALAAIGANMRYFDADVTGIPISQLSIMNNINILSDVDLAIFPPYTVWTFVPMYIRQWCTEYNVKGLDAHMMARVAPYYGTYVFGVLDGDRGKAEYETLTGYVGVEVIKLDVRNTAGLTGLTLMLVALVNGIVNKNKKEAD
jgi:hypothetical protein